MARQWLSFWNQETRRAQRSGSIHHASDADIWVPYGAGNIDAGDAVYCVAVEAGELLLFGKLTIGRIDVDPEHIESLDVWAEHATDTWFDPAISLDDATVDGLVYLTKGRKQQTFARDGLGRVSGNAFQGISSLRELVTGSRRLDRFT
jgi:hypothetical protein